MMHAFHWSRYVISVGVNDRHTTLNVQRWLAEDPFVVIYALTQLDALS